jgi:hypothetical protein
MLSRRALANASSLQHRTPIEARLLHDWTGSGSIAHRARDAYNASKPALKTFYGGYGGVNAKNIDDVMRRDLSMRGYERVNFIFAMPILENYPRMTTNRIGIVDSFLDDLGARARHDHRRIPRGRGRGGDCLWPALPSGLHEPAPRAAEAQAAGMAGCPARLTGQFADRRSTPPGDVGHGTQHPGARSGNSEALAPVVDGIASVERLIPRGSGAGLALGTCQFRPGQDRHGSREPGGVPGSPQDRFLPQRKAKPSPGAGRRTCCGPLALRFRSRRTQTTRVV